MLFHKYLFLFLCVKEHFYLCIPTKVQIKCLLNIDSPGSNSICILIGICIYTHNLPRIYRLAPLTEPWLKLVPSSRMQRWPVVERGLCGLTGPVLPWFLPLCPPCVSGLCGWAACLFPVGFSALCPSLLSFLDFFSFLYFHCFCCKKKRCLIVVIMLTE